MKLSREFYARDTLIVAKDLLGKILVHKTEDSVLKGKIVEVEAYLGLEDKAAHSYGGRKTERVRAMYGIPGTAYVYIIYGMHYCLNVVAKKEGVPEGVLLRGIEPIEGLEEMCVNRFGKPYGELSNYQKKNLTNGPGKLTKALNIDRSYNMEDLCGDSLYLLEGDQEDFHIVETTRIGIDYAEEAKDYPYRFYIKGNKNVSKL